MKIIIIAALNNIGIIGRNGTIPWRIADDLKRFKNLTMGHTVLMGRKTFESIGHPLTGRKNAVISRHSLPAKNILTYLSLDAAFADLKTEEKVFVIGGGEIFAQTIERADEMLLTVVDNTASGDVYFPPYEHLIGKHFTLNRSEQKTGFQFKDYSRMPT